MSETVGEQEKKFLTDRRKLTRHLVAEDVGSWHIIGLAQLRQVFEDRLVGTEDDLIELTNGR